MPTFAICLAKGLGHFVLWDEAELIRDNLIELFSADSAGRNTIPRRNRWHEEVFDPYQLALYSRAT